MNASLKVEQQEPKAGSTKQAQGAKRIAGFFRAIAPKCVGLVRAVHSTVSGLNRGGKRALFA